MQVHFLLCTDRFVPGCSLNFWLSSDSSAPPTFTDTPPQYVEAKEGGSITLTCTAFGNPRPSVHWLREGSVMVSSAKYKVPQRLHISSTWRLLCFLNVFCLCSQLRLKLGEFKSEMMSHKEMAQRYWNIFKNEALYRQICPWQKQKGQKNIAKMTINWENQH